MAANRGSTSPGTNQAAFLSRQILSHTCSMTFVPPTYATRHGLSKHARRIATCALPTIIEETQTAVLQPTITPPPRSPPSPRYVIRHAPVRRPRLTVIPVPTVQPWNEGRDDLPIATPVDITFAGKPCTVVPVWVNIHHNPDAGKHPRLYVTSQPMSAAMWDTLVEQHNNPEPLGKPVYTYPYAFDGADVRSGHWHNYFVAMSGAVAPYEHQTMWPNAVFHRNRARRCLRHARDLAHFLSTPQRADVEAHVANLKIKAAQEGWSTEFVVQCLVQRWGADTLFAMGVLPLVSTSR